MSRYSEASPHLFLEGEAGANVRPVYADLRRPYDMSQPVGAVDKERLIEAVANWPHFPEDKLETMMKLIRRHTGTSGEQTLEWLNDMGRAMMPAHSASSPLTTSATPDFLARGGYDSIRHVGGGNTGTAPHQVYIAFSPDQVYPSFGIDALLQRLRQEGR